MDQNPNAAREFVKLVRTFSQNIKPWQPHVAYQTMPDEIYDMSLVSQRVYGRRDEFLAVIVAAGLSDFDMPLTSRVLILPNESDLHAMKRRAGFESIAAYREGGAPTWA